MKLLGFFMILMSSILCACFYINSRGERLNELESICAMLELIRSELLCKFSPLPLIFNSVKSGVKGRAGIFSAAMEAGLEKLGAEDFGSIWNHCCEQCFLTLSEKELESLKQLSAVLGKYDVEVQASSIEECLRCLKDSHAHDAIELPQLKRLALGVTVSAASFIAILMI